MKATFEADFSTFKTAVDSAVVQLRGFEAGAEATSKSLSAMVDSFTGRKVIEEATLMAAAVEKIGGAAKLTEADLDKLARTTVAAADRFLAFGERVPATMEKTLGDIRRVKAETAAAKAEMDSWAPILVKNAASTEKLGGSITLLNQALSSLGVSAGGELGALENLLQTATGAAGAMGTLATAITVVGTALAGWKLGNILADWAQQETLLPNLAAKWLGYGDAAKEASENAADSIAKASEIVGREVRTQAEALDILTEAMKKQQQALKDHAEWLRTEALAGIKYWEDLEKRDRELSTAEEARRRKEIETIKELGRVRAEVRKLESGFTPGLLGFSAQEQQTTQRGLAAVGPAMSTEQSLAASRAAALLSPQTAEYLKIQQSMNEAQKAYTLELAKITLLEQELSIALGTQIILNEARAETARKLAQAESDLADQMNKATEEIPDIGHGPETILPWSTLGRGGATGRIAPGAAGPNMIRAGAAGPNPIMPGNFNTGGAGGSPITVNVSGVWDPATIDKMTEAIAANLLRRSGRLW